MTNPVRTPIEKHLIQALEDFQKGLQAQGGHRDKTIETQFMHGAAAFVSFLTTGAVPKREDRTKKRLMAK